jgi:peptidoglycan biosynthesis protein MviN/MurJ (putative lipid II flippase)
MQAVAVVVAGITQVLLQLLVVVEVVILQKPLHLLELLTQAVVVVVEPMVVVMLATEVLELLYFVG